jgi:hypothetical protein
MMQCFVGAGRRRGFIAVMVSQFAGLGWHEAGFGIWHDVDNGL